MHVQRAPVISAPPPKPVPWVCWRKSRPSIRGEVEAQLWMDAKQFAAWKFSCPVDDVDGYRKDLGPAEARA